MSVEKVTLGINLRKNKNSRNTECFGKYYPEVDQQKTLSLRGFADHLSKHGATFSRAVVEGVLQQIVDCLPELLAMGVPVKLNGLGTFYPTAEIVEKAGVGSIAEMEGLNPTDIVKGIHIRFLPESTKLDNLTSPAFKDACSLEFRNIVDTTEVTIDGKKRKVRTLKPIATAVAESRAATIEDEDDGTTGNTGDNTGDNTGGNNGGGGNDPDPEEPIS